LFCETDRLKPLNDEHVAFIHDNTVKILSETGMHFPSKEARYIFAKHGFKIEGEIVYFNENNVQKALESVPSTFQIKARNPKHHVRVGDNSFVFKPSGGSPFILDYRDGIRPSTAKDCRDSIIISHSLPDIDINRSLIIAGDIPPENVPLYQMLTAIKLSDKPIDCISVKGIGLLAILYGVSKNKLKQDAAGGIAHAISYINPTSPLKLSNHESERLIGLCQGGVALAVSPMPLAGMTAPCTLPGLLLSQNCEIIGTIVLSQLVNPGCPVLYGCIGTITEMKNVGSSIGAPESRVIEFAAAQLAKFYNIPSRGNAGLTDSNCVDFQAGAESLFQFTNAVRCGIHLLPGLGALGNWNVGSLEKLVLDVEIARYVKRYIRPMEFNRETMAIELIQKTGSKGNYIVEEHTLINFRKEFYSTQLFNRDSFSIWNNQGHKDTYDRAYEKIKNIIDSYTTPDLDVAIERDLEKYVSEHYPVPYELAKAHSL
jgi:trimethylamine---corrinoid protein Co-methyltransferase